jgi:anaerobic magnesium-protoporphyrin IX monomethyl ester cyclase
MKIIFISIGGDNIAIGYLSAFLKQSGHQAEIILDPRLFASESMRSDWLYKKFDTTKEIVRQVIQHNPDFVGFSVFTMNYQRCLDLARLIKKENSAIKTIFGGVHPTCCPEVVIAEDCVDIVCIGEGEGALLELMNDPRQDDIKNLWFKQRRNFPRPLIKDLDSLPFPDTDAFHDIYPGFFKKDYTISTSRGCPFACTYCSNNAFQKIFKGFGKPVRRRSPDNVIDELILAREKYGFKRITFVDDVFVQDINWLSKFAVRYKKEVGLPYIILTHPLFVTDDIVRLLKYSGCYFVLFGIQSVSEKTRREILKRYETNEDIERAAWICHKHGMRFSVDHIFNIPGEGLQNHVDALKFYNKMRPTVINAYWLQYFPKTEIVDTAVRMGITSTSPVVGLGGKDSFSDMAYSNFQFMFMLLPIFPPKIIDWIIRRKVYMMRFRPPMLLNIMLKMFINLIGGRGSVYFGILKHTFCFMGMNIKLKGGRGR